MQFTFTEPPRLLKRRGDLLAAFQRHAADTAATNVDRPHAGIRPDRRAVALCAPRQCLRNRTHAAFHVSPRAGYSIELPEGVV
jgi:hypothetical protein